MSKILLTGSRVYGPITENSDIDIVMEKEDALKLLELLEKKDVAFTKNDDYGDTSNFKFSLAEVLPPLNVIVAEDDGIWFMWQYATEEMKRLEPIINREQRIAMFHLFQQRGLDLFVRKGAEEFFRQRNVFAPVAPVAKSPEPYTPGVLNGFVDDDIPF